LVVNPSSECDFILNAYFLPTLWIMPYKNEQELLKIVNNRKFYLGLNIIAKDRKFINRVVENTNFSRYTINCRHIDIKSSEGWGGNWPTGYSGYKNWLYHFSNAYTEIG
jgi:acyl-CoA reductase-like NAD-dependent aldehyde dehydrogenase